MAEIVLEAEPGRTSGSAVSRRLIAAGRIPAVVYGHGIEPVSVSVDAREVRHALSGPSGSRALLNLKVGEQAHLAMARQLQRHPVKHTVIHIDFQVVRRDEIIAAEVPLHLVGEALAVSQANGVVEHELQSLPVKAQPGNLPAVFEVDVTNLGLGDSIRVADMVLPEGVELDIDPDTIVVVAHAGIHAEAVEAEEAPAEASEAGAGASDES